MHRESKCQHDIDEQETAVAEHLCPLCLFDKLEAVRVLADSWVGTWAETCADELEALLK